MERLLTENCDNVEPNSKEAKKSFRNRFFVKLLILITCIKILLIPTYHSTDFEVHRNWLAVTHSLPINQWYTNDMSQWTLDYPPFFAWFECALSKFAVFADPDMLKIDNLDYASNNTKLFQRTTVIVSDFVYAYGVKEVGQTFCHSNKSFIIFTILALCNIGLLIVDHIHFQYNGFLLGILMISIANVSKTSKESKVLQGAMWFAILLNLKHIYLYVAPAFIVWLLKSYCLEASKFISRFIKLGVIVTFVLALSFGPFVNQIPQVLSRLFPFKRGLLHAYWAANAWALYAGTDKLLSVIWIKAGWLSKVKVASMTGGLVQEDSFTVLPTPTPLVTFIITFLLLIPALYALLFEKEAMKNSRKFVKCIVLCGLTSFMFGWHVHEKAIITAIIPLCVLATNDAYDARIFTLLSTTGHAALFPLLYPDELTTLKFILWFTYLITSIFLFNEQFGSTNLYFHEKCYIGFLPVITFYETVLHKIIFDERLPFLPLALTSMYCALGVTYSYTIYYYDYMFNNSKFNSPITKKIMIESESSVSNSESECKKDL